jgi:hypothetical protein
MRTFQLSWFFLQCDGYALATEASSSRPFMKTEPLSPITGDCSFAYASAIAKIRGRSLGRIVELPI